MDCGRTFQSKQNAHSHAVVHVAGLCYSCQFCDETFKTKSRFSQHKFRVHKNRTREQKGKLFKMQKMQNARGKDGKISVKCPEYEKVYSKKGPTMIHYKSKHEGVRYPCNQCDYQASYRSHLQNHIQSAHEGTKSCTVITVTFRQRGNKIFPLTWNFITIHINHWNKYENHNIFQCPVSSVTLLVLRWRWFSWEHFMFNSAGCVV